MNITAQQIIEKIKDEDFFTIGRLEIRKLDDAEHSDNTSETLDAAQGDADDDSFAIIIVRGEPLA